MVEHIRKPSEIPTVTPGSPRAPEPASHAVPPRLDSSPAPTVTPLPPTAPGAAVLPERPLPLTLASSPRLPDIPTVVVTVPLNDQAEVPPGMIHDSIPPPAAVHQTHLDQASPKPQPPIAGEHSSREENPPGTPPERVIVVASSEKDAGRSSAGNPAASSPPSIQVGERQSGVHVREDASPPSGEELGVKAETIVVTGEELSSPASADTGGSGKGKDKDTPRPTGGKGEQVIVQNADLPKQPSRETGGSGRGGDRNSPRLTGGEGPQEPDNPHPSGDSEDSISGKGNESGYLPKDTGPTTGDREPGIVVFPPETRDTHKGREERGLVVTSGDLPPQQNVAATRARKRSEPFLSAEEKRDKREQLITRLAQQGIPLAQIQGMPIIERIALELSMQITNGTRRKGSRLPQADELIRMYGVNLRSIQKVLAILRREDLIRSEARGIFVKENPEITRIPLQERKTRIYIKRQPPGTVLPKLPNLARRIGINPAFAQNALSTLYREGFIRQILVEGRGNVIVVIGDDPSIETPSISISRPKPKFDKGPQFDKVIAYIRNINLSQGSRLPRVEDLAERLGMDPSTVKKAYRYLNLTGYTRGVRRRGTFILDPEKLPKRAKRSRKKS